MIATIFAMLGRLFDASIIDVLRTIQLEYIWLYSIKKYSFSVVISMSYYSFAKQEMSFERPFVPDHGLGVGWVVSHVTVSR